MPSSSNSPGRDRVDVLLSSPEVQQQHTLAACDGDDGVEFDSSSGSESEVDEKISRQRQHHHHHPITPVPAAMDEKTCSKFVPATTLGKTVVSPASANGGASKNIRHIDVNTQDNSPKNNNNNDNNSPKNNNNNNNKSSPHTVDTPIFDPFAFEDDIIDPFAFDENEGEWTLQPLCLYHHLPH